MKFVIDNFIKVQDIQRQQQLERKGPFECTVTFELPPPPPPIPKPKVKLQSCRLTLDALPLGVFNICFTR